MEGSSKGKMAPAVATTAGEDIRQMALKQFAEAVVKSCCPYHGLMATGVAVMMVGQEQGASVAPAATERYQRIASQIAELIDSEQLGHGEAMMIAGMLLQGAVGGSGIRPDNCAGPPDRPKPN